MERDGGRRFIRACLAASRKLQRDEKHAELILSHMLTLKKKSKRRRSRGVQQGSRLAGNG